MKMKKCIAMILAGGQGSRLGLLTKVIAKPAVHFGGKYRIIDFPLSNCIHSGIDTVGVLTQYQPLELNTYIGNGKPWDLDRNNGGVFVLPPYVRKERGEWYKGTANAIYQNISFIEQFDPEYVLILSGDHVYKMHYGEMIDFHESQGADATIAVIKVPMEEASRFGIMNTDGNGNIVEFEEKPANPKSDLASMGIYVFNWQKLKKYLLEDEKDEQSSNDFGKDIIPKMLAGGEKLCAHEFKGYWKDVGTIYSLWEASMDLVSALPKFNLYDHEWRIFSRNPALPPHYVAPTAVTKNTIITEGCLVRGSVERSVLFEGVEIEEGATVIDSILMPYVKVSKDAVIERSIVDSNTTIGEGSHIGGSSNNCGDFSSPMCSDNLTLIGSNLFIGAGVNVAANSMVDRNLMV